MKTLTILLFPFLLHASSQDRAKQFFLDHYEAAEQLFFCEGIPIALSLGVWALESGYGSSTAAQRNNLAGIASYKGGKHWKRFETKAEFYRAFAAIFQQPCYRNDLQPKTVDEYLRAMEWGCCSYHRSREYTKKIKWIIKKFKLNEMRKTNMQKWDELYPLYEAKENEFLVSFYNKQEKPAIIYQALINEIKETKVSRILLARKTGLYIDDKPTNKQLKILLFEIENFKLGIDDIRIEVKEDFETYTTTSQFTYNEISSNERLSFQKDELIPVWEALNLKYGNRAGFKPCAYCRIQQKEGSLHSATIIFQGTKRNGMGGYAKSVMREQKEYCNATCATHDQYAHEG